MFINKHNIAILSLTNITRHSIYRSHNCSPFVNKVNITLALDIQVAIIHLFHACVGNSLEYLTRGVWINYVYYCPEIKK